MNQNTELSDTLALSGHLTITSKDVMGKETVLLNKHNLIVNLARIFILSSLYTSGNVTRAISTLRVGTGGTIDPDGKFVKPADINQTALNNEVDVSGVPYEVVLTAVPDLTNSKVTFLADIGYGDLSGIQLTEAGLYCGSYSDSIPPILFSVKNHPGINKSSAFSLHYEWVIRI